MGRAQNNNSKPKYRKNSFQSASAQKKEAAALSDEGVVTNSTSSAASRIVEKIVIIAKLVTKTPLNIASGETDDVLDSYILKNKDNEALIPGTSLAGALRARVTDAAVRKDIFGESGENDNQSIINISDVLLDKAATEYRDGIRIDGQTGIVEDGAKFDYEVLAAGASGELTLEFTIREDSRKNKPEDYYLTHAKEIAAMLEEGISLGAGTSKGLGLIAASSISLYRFCFTADFRKWMKYLDGKLDCLKNWYSPVDSGKKHAVADFYVKMECALRGSLIVKAFDDDVKSSEQVANECNEQSANDGRTQVPARQMQNKTHYIIPGSSFKGALCARAEKILAAINKNLSAAARQKYLAAIKGFANKPDSKGQKSRLFVDEVLIAKEKLEPIEQTRNRIDRFTGGTIDGALFTVVAVWQKAADKPSIELKFGVKQCAEDEAGLMLCLLKDLWLGKLPLGGEKGVGRGVLQGLRAEIDYQGEHYIIVDGADKAELDKREHLNAYVDALVKKLSAGGNDDVATEA